MKEYVASRKLSKKLYKRLRKKHRRYTYGMAVFAVILLVMAATVASHLARLNSREQFVEYIPLGVAVILLFSIPACLVYAAAISGGREALLTQGEKCVPTGQEFVLRRENIEYRMRYEDIRSITAEERSGRLALCGAYQVLQYPAPDAQTPYLSCTVDDPPLYLYEYYPEFAQLREELRAHVRPDVYRA
ncbi:MAG: hypothetical protein ACLTWO_13005 [Blautia massiliensis (ex Durand et al. 2017)]